MLKNIITERLKERISEEMSPQELLDTLNLDADDLCERLHYTTEDLVSILEDTVEENITKFQDHQFFGESCCDVYDLITNPVYPNSEYTD